MQSHQNIITLLEEACDIMKGEMVFAEWAEEALYRATLLSLQQEYAIIDLGRAYTDSLLYLFLVQMPYGHWNSFAHIRG